MADKILLPGTEMEVFEKYPLSRRLDHPSFGNVCKTTFAKGVISDFEKIQDDPIQVKSRVKVKIGDGEESDFIPLFFNPKTLYWDGDGVLAQDFDEETGAFKQAWQSFRGGDEVAVMLKEGVPVAVMGFADGVPRLGESIVKCDFTNYHALVNLLLAPNGLVGQIYYDDDDEGYNPDTNGPDGQDLQLLQECEYSIDKGEESITINWIYKDSNGVGGDYWTAPEEDGGVNKYFYNVRFAFWRTVHTIRTDTLRLPIKIGPIEFIVYLDLVYNVTKYDQTNHIFGGFSDDGTADSPEGGAIDPGTTRGLSSMGDQVSGSVDWIAINPNYDHRPPSWDFSMSLTAPSTYSTGPNGSTTLKKITARIYLGSNQDEIEQISLNNAKMRYAWNGNTLSESGKIAFIRPHTKEELQAADLWPAGAS